MAEPQSTSLESRLQVPRRYPGNAPPAFVSHSGFQQNQRSNSSRHVKGAKAGAFAYA
jgi:hypothetical protein